MNEIQPVMSAHAPDARSHLRMMEAVILAALGATTGCGSGNNGAAVRTDVELPPQPSATQPVEAPRPPAPGKGFVKEANGSIHRASPVTCDTRIEGQSCKGDEGHANCKADTDCKDGPNGRCISGAGQIGTYCGCQYACASDADCKSEEACICADVAKDKRAVCARAACKTDADCGDKTCGVSRHDNGCGNIVQLACRTEADKCQADADCGAGERPGVQCAVGPGKTTAWSCQGRTCMIGRPLLIEGEARRAPLATGSAWTSAGLVTELAAGAAHLERALGSAEHDAIARRAIEQARLEHASIASFARASLELLALAAPPDLLRDTAVAMQDEIAHARACFAIAAAYGASATPGPLDLGGAMPSAIDPLRVAYAVGYEGCVGETLGAAEGAQDACNALDPALRDVLDRIAADELRHASLAWRTLSWIVQTFGEAARQAARRGIDDALRDLVYSDAGDVAALRREAARLVIGPCAARVLGAVGGDA